MKRFNLARWAVGYRSIVYFFVVAILIGGIYSFMELGRREDPDFTIRQMVVTAVWPGASADQMTAQVTDKLEEKLQDTPGLDMIQSYTHGDRTVIYVWLKEDLPQDRIRPTWTEVRNLVGSVWRELPKGVHGPFFNDRFDDVFGSIYALTGDDYSEEEKRVYAEQIRRDLLQIEDVQKVNLVGVRQPTVYVEMDEAKLAALGIDPRMLFQLLQQQGTLMPAGTIQTENNRISLRVTGLLDGAKAVENMTVHLGERSFRLGEIATVREGYREPKEPQMYFNGKEAIGIAVSMSPGGNILHLGKALDERIAHWQSELPLGLAIGEVAHQPHVVKKSINEFTSSLFEAIIIVLAVSFMTLGVRSGAVVALSIPVVIAGTFILMKWQHIDLQVVSLGALIIALGLLVDDAIIVIEMMQRKLEDGYERVAAATAAYEETAFPMLTGTLITAAGFIPIGLSTGLVSEYTSSLFSVTCIALVLSWIVSVLVSPVLGYSLIRLPEQSTKRGRWQAFQEELYRRFRVGLEWTLRHRRIVVLATVGVFILSVLSFPLLKKEFFPASVRPELVVETELPFGASIGATERELKRLESHFDGDSRVTSIVSYVGQSSPRFILPLLPSPPKDNYAQLVITATDAETRVKVHRDLERILQEEFPDLRANIRLIQVGPPAAYPVMMRLTGPDIQTLTKLAREATEIIRSSPQISRAEMNWPQEMPSVRVDIQQDSVRRLGIDNYAVAADLYAKLSGVEVAQAMEGDRLVPVVFRLADTGSQRLSELEQMPIHIGGGRYVPLGQMATLSLVNENATIWRRNLEPCITLQADTIGEVPGDSVTEGLYENELRAFRESLPPGYALAYDGTTERSHLSMESITKVMPVMVFVILALLMFQLKHLRLMVLAAMTAPLGLIGAILALQITRYPLGFVAVLGIISLGGMLIRNSIILLDQIEKHRAAGEEVWEAVIDSTLLRFRPIMLTAMAAVFAMIPLMRSYFWAPMAFALGGGLLVATALTLVFLPALYAWVYDAEEPDSSH